VVPQVPSLKRLEKGLGLSMRALRNAVGFTESVRDAEEAHEKWLEAPATREDVQKLEVKLFELEMDREAPATRKDVQNLEGELITIKEELREIRALLAEQQGPGDEVLK
jgi:capsule polysaccharide export protein KpsE/RkpR